jgi:hypothetical protein
MCPQNKKNVQEPVNDRKILSSIRRFKKIIGLNENPPHQMVRP